MSTKECLVQLCTSQSEFDGEWKWQAAGMAYLIRTKENRFIVVDGGENQEDAMRLTKKMKELSGSDHPTVALWIVTHPHLDHFGALVHLSDPQENPDRPEIEQLCYQFPDEPVLPRTGQTYPWEDSQMRLLTERLGVPVLVPHTEDKLCIDGIKIRFLFTPEDCLDLIKDINELSLIFQVKGEHKSVMFTGDAYERTTRPTAFRFWDELKSDYCQLAHHGLNGGSAEFYARVDAPHVLIPISVAGDRDVATWIPGTCPRQFAERMAKTCHKAFEGDFMVSL